jgi:glutathione synthase/RimK-type ligase-like ATP-grasp enzyme
MTDFTFVTYHGLPDLDPDDALAANELRARGFSVAVAVWNDTRVRWDRAGICVLRSTWDYHLDVDAFVSWATSVAAVTMLVNPLPLIRWNVRKTYLTELEQRGIPTVPTHWLPQGTRVDLRRLLAESGWPAAVVKPVVGLATYGVEVVDGSEAGQLHLNRLLGRGDAMVQPYVSSVRDRGERALVFLDGSFSHAVRKTAFQVLAPAGLAGETPCEATCQEIDLAKRALSVVPGSPLYARVDLVADDAARPLVLEMELVEPSLFLGMHGPAAARFAQALSGLARKGRP